MNTLSLHFNNVFWFMLHDDIFKTNFFIYPIKWTFLAELFRYLFWIIKFPMYTKVLKLLNFHSILKSFNKVYHLKTKILYRFLTIKLTSSSFSCITIFSIHSFLLSLLFYFGLVLLTIRFIKPVNRFLLS